jgi:hypothetical protein
MTGACDVLSGETASKTRRLLQETLKPTGAVSAAFGLSSCPYALRSGLRNLPLVTRVRTCTQPRAVADREFITAAGQREWCSQPRDANNRYPRDVARSDRWGCAHAIETTFLSLDAMEQMVAMGMEEGTTLATGQIDCSGATRTDRRGRSTTPLRRRQARSETSANSTNSLSGGNTRRSFFGRSSMLSAAPVRLIDSYRSRAAHVNLPVRMLTTACSAAFVTMDAASMGSKNAMMMSKRTVPSST